MLYATCWNKALKTRQLMYEAHTLNKKDNPSLNDQDKNAVLNLLALAK